MAAVSGGALVKYDEFQQLLERLQGLTADEKLEIVRTILPQPLQVVMGGSNQMSGSIIVQVNMADKDVVADILDAVSDRLRHPSPETQH
jgi:hypothetical protein